MIRGILAGGLWGFVIGAVVIALTSQIADWRDLSPALGEGQAAAEIVAEAPAAVTDQAPSVVAAAERAPRVSETTPQVEAGAADEISSPMLDTLPPSAPQAGSPAGVAGPVDTDVATPEAPQELETAALEPPAPVAAPAPEVDQPPVPEDPALAPAASAPAALAEVAAPDAPEPEATDPAAQVAAVDSAPRVVAEVPETADAASSETRPAVPAAPEPVAETAAVDTAPDAPEADTQVADAPAVDEPPVTETKEVAITAPEPEPAADPTPAVAAAEPEPAAPKPAPITAGDQGGGTDGNPQILRIADGDRALPGRRVTSLPQVGGGDAPEEAPASPEAPEVAEAPEADMAAESEMSALDRNRVAFEAPDGAGLIAVVLVHEDGPALDLPVAGALAVPLTLAIPAGLPNAEEVARAYRAAGHEVAAIPDLPPRPRAQDVEVALPVTLAAVPGAVAVMDAGDDGGFQDDRGATESVVAAMVESGHGLLTWPRGFNTAQKLAEQEGVAAALVFRALETGDAAAVTRQLDQVAFRARQDGGIVMVGRADPAMIEALSAWVAEARRTDTVLAPLSAVLMGE